ncbi:hypothetical protein [Paraburkholderia sp.]|jgi:hypothetical protein|uniref:hypothetical protein n=1 Tax=Paraburkholderia sp. TaxID=1926495 RepID=UPI003C7E0DC3
MNGLTSEIAGGPDFRYKARVRSTTPPQCIWGSVGMEIAINFPTPPIMHIHNDKFGAPVTFGTQVISGSGGSPVTTPYGTLQPGECISFPLQGFSGVFAYCESAESTVYCVIKA